MITEKDEAEYRDENDLFAFLSVRNLCDTMGYSDWYLFRSVMVTASCSAVKQCQLYANIMLLPGSIAFIHRSFLAGIHEITVAESAC